MIKQQQDKKKKEHRFVSLFILYIIYFRFFKSSNRRAKSSKPGSSEPPCAPGGVDRSLAVGTCGNGSLNGMFALLSAGKPRRAPLVDGGGGGSDGAKLIFGY